MYVELTWAVVISIALQGCTRSEAETKRHEQSAAEWEAPTEWASGPAPHPKVENGAPLNNAAGYPEQARNSSPDERNTEPQAGSERTARGEFVAAKGRKLSGEAELQEVGSSVRVHVEVEKAQPGMRRVVFSKDTDCSKFAETSAVAPTETGAGIGEVTIAQDGSGEATLSIQDANLRPDSDRSYTSGALLLYAPERIATAGNRREMPIACATIASR